MNLPPFHVLVISCAFGVIMAGGHSGAVSVLWSLIAALAWAEIDRIL